MKVTQGVHLKAALPSEIKSIPDGSGQGIIIYVLQKEIYLRNFNEAHSSQLTTLKTSASASASAHLYRFAESHPVFESTWRFEISLILTERLCFRVTSQRT